jgi:methionyl-tRNA formyltransferase
MLNAPRRGCLNIHASLLPRWRGAAPIQAAILSGDAASGITIMRMDAGLDTGPMLLAEAVPIGPRTTAAMLHDALAEVGARLVLRALDENPAPCPQPEDGATYAPKLTREDGGIDWTRDAAFIERQVRALNPWPGTFTTWAGATLKVLDCVVVDGQGEAGTVLDARLTVGCGQGAVRLLRVQAPGGAAMDAAAFLRGHALPPGSVLGALGSG